MEHTLHGADSGANAETGPAQHRKAADYVYQAATVAAALLLILTAAVV
jgi:hypothetical protein